MTNPKKHRVGNKQTAALLADGSFAEQNFPVAADGLTTNRVTVGATAVKLADYDGMRIALLVSNAGSEIVFLGKSVVTAATGYPLAPGGSIRLETTSETWAVTASGSVNVHVLALTL